MATDSISFSCPACDIKLTVPGNLAGITGPCPSCRAQIQAPYPTLYQAPPAAPVYQTPACTPATSQPAAEAVPPPAPAVLRPEPRQLPHRSSHGEPVAKQMPEPNRSSQAAKDSNALPRHPHSRNRILRFLMPALFLIASGAVVFGVLTVLKNQSKEASRSEPLSRPPERKILSEDPLPANAPAGHVEKTIPSMPVPAPARPSIMEPPPSFPEGGESATPGKAAMQALEKFLTAKTLAERLPMMETQTQGADLEKSCLARPLPTTSKIEIDAQETNALEEVVDIYYNVDFGEGNSPMKPETILVRIRGTSDPKIVADPFLDTFGGRLAAYANAPSDKAGVFQVIISAVASCNDELVPNREKKLTLKLLPRDNTKEIARAYFGRQSKIAQMLEDGTYSLSYGKAKACTVMLRWNREDKPETPYLEALDLKTLDWNP